MAPLRQHLDCRTDKTAKEMRDTLKRYIDSNDELLVIDVTGDPAAWSGFNERGSKWLRDNL